MSIWSWLADAVLVLLLLGTLGMVARLDRSMRMVRQDRAVFEALIANLSSATGSVKLGIQALRTEADRAAEQIGRRSEDADKMATDLSFLIEAADRAGASLEEKLRAASSLQAPAAEPVVKPRKLRAARRQSRQRWVEEAPEPTGAPGASDALRALAGITTRRRSGSPGASVGPHDATLAGQEAGDPAPSPGRSIYLIKKAG